MNMVGLEVPTVEVRYRNLSVEVEYEVVHGKPLPTLWNTLKNAFGGIAYITGCKSVPNKIKILKNVNGIIKPSRMTLLLGPPGCGKTTLLQALAAKLDKSLKVEGEISYNGYRLNEFVPQKTSVYISQYDQHISEMTVRETLDFSARCQGIGGRAVSADNLYEQATSFEGLKRTLQTDYILKVVSERDQGQYWFFYQFFLLFLVHQVSISMFRLIASIVRNPSIASTCALFIILITFLFGGFVIRKPSLPSWLRWGFWLSPLAYAEIGASLNEFLAPRFHLPILH
ncbi:hypothetical protein OIU77_024514 [Salix suchowensis]|uniref:ABC transporter domain-containing protein n=1 Tax=Salix suchowensis TaxID=1278906 RepID=A0ABQ9BT10_9ROSI|nr:hypothetical protein OIU77_024514 [Salix suchowensis]